MAAMFTGFVAVLALVLRGGHMAVAFGVIFAFVGVYFAVPCLFPKMAGEDRSEGAELGRVQRSWNHDGDRPFDCA